MRASRFLSRPSLGACFLSLLLCYVILITGTTIPVARGALEVPSARPAHKFSLKPPTARVAAAPALREGELLVRFRPSATEPAINNLLGASGGQLLRKLRGVSRFTVVRVPRGLEERAVAELRRSPLVEWAEPNALITQETITPNDPRFGEQWALRNTGVNNGLLGADLHITEAWETTTGSLETVIAVIDSGIDFSHPDLRANQWTNHQAGASTANPLPGGFINDRHGWDFVADTPGGKDEAGHGTAVAGLIAAEGNNRIGISGVMWRAGLMDLRVLDGSGTGDIAAAVEAIDYATAHGAQILNLSWGTDYPSRALSEALQRASRFGVLAVCAAGNQGRELSVAPRYPAALALGNILAVTATDEYDGPATWSNFGARTGTLAAPGVNLLTTKPDGDYQTITGTSGAAALVSGVAGLIRTVRPYLSAEQTKSLLRQGARATGGSAGPGGLAQASGALSQAANLPVGEGLTNTRNQNGGAHKSQAPVAPANSLPGANAAVSALPNVPGVGGPPRSGLPNLDVLRQQQPQPVRSRPHIPPPAWRHPRIGRAPRNGLRVGDPLPGVDPGPNPTPGGTPTVTPTPQHSPPATPLAGLVAPDSPLKQELSNWIEADTFTRGGPSASDETDPTLLAFAAEPVSAEPALAHATTNPAAALVSLSVEGWFLDFYQTALVQYPLASEQDYWYDLMRKARETGSNSCANGQCLLAARDVGRTIFESPAYYGRSRDNHWYVYDLYKAYFRREPDSAGWAWWEGVVGTYGRDAVRRAFDESGEFSAIIDGLDQEGASSSAATNVWAAKQDLLNGTGGGGVDPVSRNFGWSLPLVGLPGRAGLDLGLTLAYNSSVWTKSGPYAYFDEENGFPGPGFRLGFPTIQNPYFNPNTGKNSYLLITPSGGRVELRQVGSGTTYEAADSSYLQLLDQGGSLWLRSTDGTQLSFSKINDEWRCVQIKDRNGNYLTITYKWWGQIDTITDTLGRVLTFEYFSSNQNLYRITQNWGGATRVYAEFVYTTSSISSPFGSGAIAIGAGIGTTQTNSWPLLTQVWLSDGSHVDFGYLGSGQVFLIKRWANDGVTELGNDWLNMDSAAGYQDRVSWASMKAKNWNLVGGLPQDVYTYYDTPTTASWNWTAPYGTAADGTGKKTRITLPDNTKQDIYFFDTGWKRGLVGYTETLDAVNTMQRRSGTIYTQDDTNLSYRQNPRPTESAVGDPAGNNRRSKVSYASSFGLPQDIEEYGANGISVLRRTHIDYLSTSLPGGGVYFDNRIIGLPEYSYLYDESNQLAAKSQLVYDTPANLLALPNAAAATQHDTAYNTATKRGLVTKTVRHKTSSQAGDNSPATITNEAGYYVTGTAAFARDPLGNQSNITYTDSFSDNINRNTFAYPTKGTDPDGFFSTVIYNFNFGGVTRTEGSPPANNPNGAINTTTYDGIGRVERVTTVNNGAYTKFLYGPDYTASWTTINTLAEEVYSVQFVDGLGQVYLAGSQHPGSVGQYKAQTTTYDKMGRVVKSSNPAEVNSSWNPAGEDSGGWHYREQTYDWKGRPRVKHFDWETGTDSDTEIQYEGCGCAGGEVMTLIGENVPIAGTNPTQYGRRKQKVYHDSLGRTVKTEVYNWPAPNGNGLPYASTVTEYNALDQVRFVKEYAGEATGSNFQASETQYDGHGRPWRARTPEMDNTKWQAVTYNNDDTAQFTTDPRGVNINYTYNNRRLVTGITYDKSAATNPDSIPTVPTANYTYDAVGNRLSMDDSNSTVLYQYDQLSRLTSESRTFNGLSGSYTLSYEYSIGGLLKKLTTDPFTASINYTYDGTGQLTGVTATGTEVEPTYISNVKYRAWGATNRVDFGNATYQTTNFDLALRPTSFAVNNVRFDSSTPNSSGTTNWSYNYNSDGRLQQSSASGDNRFDQRFEYDQLGRIKEAWSGNEARGQQPDLPNYSQVPYRSSFTYNPFGQMTARTGRVYWRPQTDSGNYLNNRRTDYGYVYNETGRLVEDKRKYTYDAANRHTRTVSSWQIDMAGDGSTEFPFQPSIDIAQTYDADGQTVKRNQTSRWNLYDPENPSQLIQVMEDGQTNFDLRSSVLGGAVILRLVGSGQSVAVAERDIYAGRARIAQTSILKGRIYEHHNPVTGSWITTNYNAPPWWNPYQNWYVYSDRQVGQEERDPTGGELPLQVPDIPYYPAENWQQPLFIEGGDPFDYSSGYEVDGLPVSTADFNRRAASGGVQRETLGHNGNTWTRRTELVSSSGYGSTLWIDTPGHSTYELAFDPQAGWYPVPTAFGGGGYFAPDLGVPNFAHPLKYQEWNAPLKGKQKTIVENTIKAADEALSNNNCASAATGLSTDIESSPQAQEVLRNVRFRYSGAAPGAVATTKGNSNTGNKANVAYIGIYDVFFKSKILTEAYERTYSIKGYSIEQLRVLALLHELRHTFTGPHRGATFEDIMAENNKWNQEILAACFGTNKTRAKSK